MSGELIRTVLGYLFAFTVFLFGGFFFYTGYLDIDAPALPPEADAFSVALVGFMGMALQWVFGTATQAATAGQAKAATQSGVDAAMTPVPGSITQVSAGPPQTVTVTPQSRSDPEDAPEG
jgi:hypothetical protein